MTKTGAQNVKVTVTYPDGSTDTVDTTVTLKSQADLNDPKGQNLTTKVGVLPDAKTGIVDAAKLPAGTTFKWKTNPDVSKAADAVSGTIVVTYPDKSTDEVTISIKVTSDASTHNPSYPGAKTYPGVYTQIPQIGDMAIPAKTVYSIDTSKLPTGWTAAINPSTGEIVATAPATAKAGDKISIPVTVTYPDKAVDTATATVDVLATPTNGTDGKDGTNGTNGKDGVDGTNGTNGVDGKDGANGTNGTNGTDGKDGANGKSAFDLWKELPGNEDKTLSRTSSTSCVLPPSPRLQLL